MAAAFDRLGCPLAQDKTEALTTCLEYLGIKIDTIVLEMCPRRTSKRDCGQLYSSVIGENAAQSEICSHSLVYYSMLLRWCIQDTHF